MSERWRIRSTPRPKISIVREGSLRQRVALIADGQWGRVRTDQLTSAGVSGSTIKRWIADGYLHPRCLHVFAVGHAAPNTEADLTEALLYAGPGAMLSHQTAAWWWQLTGREPKAIEVSTPRRCRSLARAGSLPIRIHPRRSLERVWHRRLPVTTVPQTLLDFASVTSLRDARYALAQADYRRVLDFNAVERVCGRGRPGSDALRRALDQHRPELAYTRSELERRFVELCERGGLPIPRFNVKLMGVTVDALWREQRVVVELDGKAGHGTPAQIAHDHDRDLRLRTAGFTVLRYTWEQVIRRGDLILVDLRRALELL